MRRSSLAALHGTLVCATLLVAPAHAQQYAVEQAGGPPTAAAPTFDAARTTYTSSTPTDSASSPPSPLAPSTQRLAPAKPLPKLAPPGGDDEARTKSGGSGSGAIAVVGSLGVVLGLFLVAAWLMRRGLPQQNRTLPKEAVETLGRIPFPARQQGQLLRVGNKLVLVSFSAAGAHAIAQITDPLEVDRLAGLCAQNDPHGATRSFRDVVDGFFREKPSQSKRSTPRSEENDVA